LEFPPLEFPENSPRKRTNGAFGMLTYIARILEILYFWFRQKIPHEKGKMGNFIGHALNDHHAAS
jgi:hypothetical protein